MRGAGARAPRGSPGSHAGRCEEGDACSSGGRRGGRKGRSACGSAAAERQGRVQHHSAAQKRHAEDVVSLRSRKKGLRMCARERHSLQCRHAEHFLCDQETASSACIPACGVLNERERAYPLPFPPFPPLLLPRTFVALLFGFSPQLVRSSRALDGPPDDGADVLAAIPVQARARAALPLLSDLAAKRGPSVREKNIFCPSDGRTRLYDTIQMRLGPGCDCLSFCLHFAGGRHCCCCRALAVNTNQSREKWPLICGCRPRRSVTFCVDQISSAFVQKEYPQLKTENPKLPMLVREAANVEPRLVARYGTAAMWAVLCAEEVR